MPRITIDGRPIDVPAGATVLEAARRLGVDIPTMCHVQGLEPLTTCYVCVVRVAGRRGLCPACATVATEGMAVENDTVEVQAARKTAVELLLSDHLGECAAPCEIACPAGLRIATFMDDLAAGDVAEASTIARHDLVLPGVLGLICPAFCERACRRAERDQPLAIADLHHRAAERELKAAAERELKASGAVESNIQNPKFKIGKVAIVGAGPAGLAAAFNLLSRGHDCTLFDQQAEPGGMIRCGFDATRVPRALLDGEINVIRRMGAKFRMNTRLGRDITVLRLRGEFDAVLLAIGAPVWTPLTCEGAELAESAGPVLTRLAGGQGEAFDGDLVVIGGQEAIDMARSAVRHGAASVTVLCPKPAEHLALLGPRIELARKEGIRFLFGVEVQQIRKPAHRLYLLAVGPNREVVKVDCNRLLVAAGRLVELDLLAGQGVTSGPRGVVVDRATLATNLPGVFAAGDAVSGGGFAVRAVAYGQAAAEAIDQYLTGRPVVGRAHPHIVRYGKLSAEERAMLLARTRNPGPRSPVVADERAARAEAARCLICGCQDNTTCRLRQGATRLHVDSSRFKGERRAMERDASHPLIVYESGKCIQCGACVKLCEQAAGEPGSALAAGGGLTYIGRGFNVRVAVPWGGKLAEALAGTLAELARRCAEACPTSAIVLKRKKDAS